MRLMTPDLEVLKVARYEIHLRACANAVLPPFLGSALRGAFGHALKAVACSMPHGDCGRCLLVERCLYPKLFETSARSRNRASSSGARTSGFLTNDAVLDGGDRLQGAGRTPENGMFAWGAGRLLKKRQDAPRPFIFIPPLPSTDSGLFRARDDLLRWRVRVKAGEPVVFGLSLIGDAINDLPYVIYAISLMAQHGFGAERVPFALERVAAITAQGDRQIVYLAQSNRIEEHLSCHSSLGMLTRARLIQLLMEPAETAKAETVGLVTRRQAASAGVGTAGAAREISATSAAPGRSGTVPAAATQTSVTRAASALGRPEDASADMNAAVDVGSLVGSSTGNWLAARGNEITLSFITPTRMRLKGRVIEDPSFSQLISSLSLRLSMLAETFADAPLSYDYKSMIERARDVTTHDSTLRLMALDRYSNRRGKLELDGFMGDVTFAGPAIYELLPLLVAGEFLHVGSGTAFGLGRYVIV